MQSSHIAFGFERKVMELGGFPQPFQLDERASSSKERMSLGGDRLSGRLFKGSMLLEGCRVRFHIPSLTIESGDRVEGQGRSAFLQATPDTIS
jgi:hypothetical protein